MGSTRSTAELLRTLSQYQLALAGADESEGISDDYAADFAATRRQCSALLQSYVTQDDGPAAGAGGGTPRTPTGERVAATDGSDGRFFRNAWATERVAATADGRGGGLAGAGVFQLWGWGITLQVLTRVLFSRRGVLASLGGIGTTRGEGLEDAEDTKKKRRRGKDKDGGGGIEVALLAVAGVAAAIGAVVSTRKARASARLEEEARLAREGEGNYNGDSTRVNPTSTGRLISEDADVAVGALREERGVRVGATLANTAGEVRALARQMDRVLGMVEAAEALTHGRQVQRALSCFGGGLVAALGLLYLRFMPPRVHTDYLTGAIYTMQVGPAVKNPLRHLLRQIAMP